MHVNPQHEANRRHWDRGADQWRLLRDRDGLWKTCPREPELAFEGGALEQIRRLLKMVEGKSVCVVGSGDNYAAFALAGCGARVTSVDISQRQLDVAADRAAQLALDIEFVRSDASDLGALASGRFDLATSSNGFFVWIAEPRRVFAEIFRVLRPGGSYVFYDVHPFQRPWSTEGPTLAMRKPYCQTTPEIDDDTDEVTYEFHWTLADLLNPLAGAGFRIESVLESPPRSARFWQDSAYLPASDENASDWRHNALAGLPAWLTVCAQKP